MPLIFFLAVTKCLRGEALTSAMCLLSFLLATMDLERENSRDISLEGGKWEKLSRTGRNLTHTELLKYFPISNLSNSLLVFFF